MKKLLVILTVSFAMVSCGGGDNSANEQKQEGKEQAKEVATETKAKSPEYEKGLALVAKSDCFTCHKVKETAIGPSYEAVAAKYENTEEVVDKLAAKVISGGSGNWGSVPMTPHPQLSKEDAKAMVRYVLELKK